MPATPTYASDVVFTDTVKAIQARKGSREAYARVEARGWRTEIDVMATILPQPPRRMCGTAAPHMRTTLSKLSSSALG